MIYFAQQGSAGPIKIGFTNGPPEERLEKLRTASPFDIYLVGWMKGNRKTEENLHDRFSKYRLSGEWFMPCRAILKYIKDMADTGAFDWSVLHDERFWDDWLLGQMAQNINGDVNLLLQDNWVAALERCQDLERQNSFLRQACHRLKLDITRRANDLDRMAEQSFGPKIQQHDLHLDFEQ